MKKSGLLTLFIFLLLASKSLPPAGANEYKSFFTWNENKKLNWADFQGDPVSNSAEVAMTASSVEFSYYSKGEEVGWTVTAKYFPKLSWSRRPEQTDYILQHEQLHFNITELYARLFRKRLSENVKTARDIQKIKTIGKEIMRDWDIEQHAYDKETDHSMNEEKQAEWNLNVKERLDDLKEFASK